MKPIFSFVSLANWVTQKKGEGLAVFILSGIFIYAAVVKLADVPQFFQDIQSYRLLPENLAWWLAHYLPWLEVSVAIALFFSKLRFPSALILVGLMLVFIIGLLSAWYRGLDISCGCFGASSPQANYPLTIIRDLGFLLLALFLAWSSHDRNLTQDGDF
jgi:putative oxidoreductase